MTDQREEMEKLGFKLSGSTYYYGEILVVKRFNPRRPWCAAFHGTYLWLNSDTLDRGLGRIRTFKTPMAAAKAALERWS